MSDHLLMSFWHTGDKQSALRLIQTLVHDNTQVTLALQRQMANESKSLEETDAGKELHSEIIKEREKFEKSLAETQRQTQEALKARDAESAKALKEVQNDYKHRIKQLERSRNDLKVDLEEMSKRRFEKLEAAMQERDDRHREELRQIERDRSQKEAALLREKQAAEQREATLSSALKNLQLRETIAVPSPSPSLPLSLPPSLPPSTTSSSVVPR